MPADWSEAVAQLDNGTESSPRTIEPLNQAVDTLFAISRQPGAGLLPSTALSYCVTPQRLANAAATYLIDVRRVFGLGRVA